MRWLSDVARFLLLSGIWLVSFGSDAMSGIVANTDGQTVSKTSGGEPPQASLRAWDPEGPVYFGDEDVLDAAALVSRIREGKDPVSAYLRERLTDDERKLFQSYEAQTQPSDAVKQVLTNSLNTSLSDKSLFTKGQFDKSALLLLKPADVDKLGGRDLMRLNRFLLLEAYSGELRANHPLLPFGAAVVVEADLSRENVSTMLESALHKTAEGLSKNVGVDPNEWTAIRDCIFALSTAAYVNYEAGPYVNLEDAVAFHHRRLSLEGWRQILRLRKGLCVYSKGSQRLLGIWSDEGDDVVSLLELGGGGLDILLSSVIIAMYDSSTRKEKLNELNEQIKAEARSDRSNEVELIVNGVPDARTAESIGNKVAAHPDALTVIPRATSLSMHTSTFSLFLAREKRFKGWQFRWKLTQITGSLASS